VTGVLSYLENDQKSPTLEILVKLCRTLKLPVSELIMRAEGPCINLVVEVSYPKSLVHWVLDSQGQPASVPRSCVERRRS
jgi:transcriptional regulator with XRE-family HTH domain